MERNKYLSTTININNINTINNKINNNIGISNIHKHQYNNSNTHQYNNNSNTHQLNSNNNN